MTQATRIYDSYHEQDYDMYKPADRFYVRSSVFLPSSEVDPRTGMLRQEERRVGRTQAKRMEATHLDREYEEMDAALQARQQEKGLRISLRKTVLGIIALIFLLGMILLIQLGTLTQRQRMLKNLNERLVSIQQENAELESQIAIASDSGTICYAAARDLGMVPASTMQAIHLTAVDTRPGTPTGHVTASAGLPSGAEIAASPAE